MKKITDAGSEPGPHFDHDWFYQLCELMMTPQVRYIGFYLLCPSVGMSVMSKVIGSPMWLWSVLPVLWTNDKWLLKSDLLFVICSICLQSCL